MHAFPNFYSFKKNFFQVGSGGGTGFNVNIAFSGKQSFQGVTSEKLLTPTHLTIFLNNSFEFRGSGVPCCFQVG